MTDRRRIEYQADLDTKRFESGARRMEGTFGKLGGFLKDMPAWAKAAGGALVASFSVQAITDGIRQTIDAASNLEESVNAVRVSTGRAADGIIQFGETAAQKLGLSQRQVNEYATAFSGMVDQIEAGGGNVNGIYQEMLTRVSDFASVYNLDMAEAFQKFQSGLAGSSEAVRRYGIDISAATVEQHALEEGIWDGTGAMTEAQKVTARYSLLMQQTDKVAGDFAATSDSLANSQRRLTAAIENLQAEMGEAYAPAAAAAVDTTTDFVYVGNRVAQTVGSRMAPQFGQLAKYVAAARNVFGLYVDDMQDAAQEQETLAQARGRDMEMIEAHYRQQERFNGLVGEAAGDLRELAEAQKAHREELEKTYQPVANYDAMLANIIRKYQIMQGLAPNWGDFGNIGNPGYSNGQFNPENAGKQSSDNQSRWDAVNGGPQ